ncbi:nuclear transport factor 2 family protein [Burkholderia glumae]|uniref:nuclear transport factor 2 family protein n=1 Tax=Burkholderia glumae TaxID=337 RepID=UPI002151C439|nr:nuclear transport factor 2 family protein [Burkholderia glumae]
MDHTTNEIVEKVRTFWSLMATNDFDSVGQVLSENFTLEWPQSNERIRGATNFARMNSEYPAQGRWQFTVNRIIGSGDEAVSDVSVTDGVLRARAISFFTMSDGKISRIVEFWPDDYPAPANRRHLVEPIS